MTLEKEIKFHNECKTIEKERYIVWLTMDKEQLVHNIKVFWLSTYWDKDRAYMNWHKVKWYKKAYREKFCKNFRDRIVLFFM